VNALKAMPDDGKASLAERVDGVCAKVMGRGARICLAAALDDHQAEAYIEAVSKGCERFRTAVLEATADSGDRPFIEIIATIQSIATDIKRWLAVSDDDPDIRRRPLA
jgi:hypothetical protein